MAPVPYRPRLADAPLHEALQHHPVVLIDGPRACGKTTTALQVARHVVRFDVPAQAAIFRADPDAALRAYGDRPLLIDEWQEVPEVIGAVKRAADTGAPAGSFVLTGSVRASTQALTWAGTGRLVHLQMASLVQREQAGRLGEPDIITALRSGSLPPSVTRSTPDVTEYVDLSLAGGYPTPVLGMPEAARAGWYRSYVEEISRRDVRSILRRSDPDRVRSYLEAYALNSAGVCDHTTIFGAAGISRKTAESYDSVLERLFIVERVPAWSSNRLSRLIHQPKRFFLDTGLLCAAARITRDDVLGDGHLLGRTIETFVFSQIRSEVAMRHPEVRVHHLRTEKGRHEVDLLLDLGAGRVIGIEVKNGASADNEDARHLVWLREQLGDDFVAGVVLHTGTTTYRLDERISAAPISAIW